MAMTGPFGKGSVMIGQPTVDGEVFSVISTSGSGEATTTCKYLCQAISIAVRALEVRACFQGSRSRQMASCVTRGRMSIGTQMRTGSSLNRQGAAPTCHCEQAREAGSGSGRAGRFRCRLWRGGRADILLNIKKGEVLL